MRADITRHPSGGLWLLWRFLCRPALRLIAPLLALCVGLPAAFIAVGAMMRTVQLAMEGHLLLIPTTVGVGLLALAVYTLATWPARRL